MIRSYLRYALMTETGHTETAPTSGYARYTAFQRHTKKCKDIEKKLTAPPIDFTIPHIGNLCSYIDKNKITKVWMISDSNRVLRSTISAETIADNTSRKLKIIKTDKPAWPIDESYEPVHSWNGSRIKYRQLDNLCIVDACQEHLLKKQYQLIIGKAVLCSCFGQEQTCGGIPMGKVLQFMEGVGKQLKPEAHAVAILTGNSPPHEGDMENWNTGAAVLKKAVTDFNSLHEKDNLFAVFWETTSSSGKPSFGTNISYAGAFSPLPSRRCFPITRAFN